jgi:hypothetical protein
VASLGPLDENKWLGLEEKLMSNYFIIAGDPDHIKPKFGFE